MLVAQSLVGPPPTTAAPTELVLEVSRTEGLDPSGETVTVVGRGYDESRGIYVAFCVVPPPGDPPTPCGGGIDLENESAASAWISSHPPDYGEGLAEPYGRDGSFEVSIRLHAVLNDDVDCRQVQCAVVTRADHTRLADRSLDVIVPVFFADDPSATATPTPTTAAPAPTLAPATTAAPTTVAAPPPVRGAAPVWPVWVATGAAALGLVAVRPRNRRPRGARDRSE